MMRILSGILFFSFLVISRAYAQDIPNAGFETWVQQGPFEIPEAWDCGPTGSKSSSAHSGAFALVLQSGIFTNPMSGTTDTLAGGGNTGIGGPPGTPHVDGFAFALRPDSLASWYKYNAVGQDSFRLQVVLSRWNPGAGSREVVAAAEMKASSASDWTRIALALNYFNGENPDTASIRYQSSVSDPQNPVLGSSLTVDDLSFVYNPLAIKKISRKEVQFEVAPNPVSDLLKIDVTGPTLVQIIDAKGNLVISSIKAAESYLQVSTLPSGFYCIRLYPQLGEEVRFARLIKE